MPPQNFLSALGKHLRVRSKTRSEANITQDPSKTEPATPRPAGSSAGLATGPSTLPTSLPSALQNPAFSGTRAAVFRVIYLTVPLPNTDNIVSDSAQSATKKAKRSKPWDRFLNQSAATTIQKNSGPSQMPVAHAPAKVVIDAVKKSSDVFPLLKSAASGLSSFLKHCDVRMVCFPSPLHDTDDYPSKR